ncbi:MAG: hypothetical protein IPK82_06430 [Polyangiaceae bacterium]|nr:hypothetical protein [Polyangiaceae bacterium]
MLSSSNNSSGGSGGDGGSGAGPTTTTNSGGTTSTPTTSTSSSTDTTFPTTGSGGTTITGPCAELSVYEPYATLAGGLQVHQRSPKLGYSSPDGMSVTLATAWQDADPPGPNPPIELRHTSFEPWIDFPDGSLGPTYLADLDAGVSFAISRGNPGDFALLHRDFKTPPASGLRFSADFKPKSGDVPASILADANADDALFVRDGGGGKWLFAGAEKMGANYEVRAGITNGSLVEADFPVSCVNSLVKADAVATSGGFLMAVTADTASPSDCSTTPVSIGGPTVFVVQGNQIVGTNPSMQGHPAQDVVMAPRSNGAWVVWQAFGGEDLPEFTYVMSVDEKGLPVVGAVQMPMICLPDSLAAASFEDFLIVGCITFTSVGPAPVVQVVDPFGDLRAYREVGPTGDALGRVALIGSPMSRSALLVWSEDPGAGGDQMRITRLDCLDKG